MKFSSFTVQELKEHPSFRRMVRGIASAEEVENWNEWIESSNANRLIAKESIAEIIGFEFQPATMPEIDQEWARLHSATIKKTKKPFHLNRRHKDNTLKRVWLTCAVVLLMSFIGVGTYLFHEKNVSVPHLEQLTAEKTIATEKDEQKTLKFSNGSKIILRSNSSLTYRLGSSNNPTIEVTLEGEAWFEADVNDESKQPAFAISTPDGVIRDIGTKFLVTVENNHSRVVLQEGIVEIESLSGSEVRNEEVLFRAQRGEMVEFRRSNIITRKKVNPTFYTSWATGFMELEQSGILEFAEYVEQRFDVEVQFRDSNLMDVQLNGTVYFRSLDELMRSISEVVGIPVYRSAQIDTVYIGSQKQF